MWMFPTISNRQCDIAPSLYRTAEGSTPGTGNPGNGNDTFFQRREHAEVDNQASVPSGEGSSPTASACCSPGLPLFGAVTSLDPTMPSPAVIVLDRAIELHQAGDLEAAAVAYTKLLRVRALGS